MKRNTILVCLFLSFFTSYLTAQSLTTPDYEPGSFPLVSAAGSSMILTDPNDDSLVQIAAGLLQQDLGKVTGRIPSRIYSLPDTASHLVILGTLGKSSMIGQLLAAGKINPRLVTGRWEAFQVQVIDHPFHGIEQALVVYGSDRRGTAYGTLRISEDMGVSPWYWWADVPVKKKNAVYVRKGINLIDSPLVKYRGIFINDEAPALSGWSKEKFGGFNHQFYANVFELILRLKGNYLWPAMWGNAFYDDDSLNRKTADDYGIVIGTSHHEPLMRAHDEWRRYGHGPWNYDSNETALKNFWEEGMRRVGKTETIVTVGMRGDGDKPMTEGTAISLLERIVRDQREIIEKTTGKPAEKTPQMWALYKEVQDYYDKGMRVPDDVTLLLCDDNWGNIRRLPALTDNPRSGGYGIYYHFDYVGDPRNYKWLNTNQIERTWEQMHLAYSYGVSRIWIVNVGDIKPMEFPISFFLDYAWNPNRWNEDNLPQFYGKWSSTQFGQQWADPIGQIIQQYTQFNARRKPELLSADTYSLTNYREADRVVDSYKELFEKAQKINHQLPVEYRDAFFELVLHPVKACANLNEMYVAVARNRKYASENSQMANYYADKAKQLYLRDSLISLEYNHGIAGGKWNHMMDQTHIGYTYWQQPPFNKMPDVTYISGKSTRVSGTSMLAPPRDARSLIPPDAKAGVFFEEDGLVSMYAAHYTKSFNSNQVTWKEIKHLGRDGSATGTFPVTLGMPEYSPVNPHLEYEFYCYDSGAVRISAYFSPTLNIHHEPEGLRYALSVDDGDPVTVSINKDDSVKQTWEGWVANNIIIKTTSHLVTRRGRHILKYWMISPAVMLQKVVIDFGGLRDSYLGPPETITK